MSTARLVIFSNSLDPWRRSSTPLNGVSTSISLVADAISTERGSSAGGTMPRTWYATLTAASSASRKHTTTDRRSRNNSWRCLPRSMG